MESRTQKEPIQNFDKIRQILIEKLVLNAVIQKIVQIKGIKFIEYT